LFIPKTKKLKQLLPNEILKEYRFKYFSEKSRFGFIDVINDLMQSYHLYYHPKKRMPQAHVSDRNKETVWNNLYGESRVGISGCGRCESRVGVSRCGRCESRVGISRCGAEYKN